MHRNIGALSRIGGIMALGFGLLVSAGSEKAAASPIEVRCTRGEQTYLPQECGDFVCLEYPLGNHVSARGVDVDLGRLARDLRGQFGSLCGSGWCQPANRLTVVLELWHWAGEWTSVSVSDWFSVRLYGEIAEFFYEKTGNPVRTLNAGYIGIGEYGSSYESNTIDTWYHFPVRSGYYAVKVYAWAYSDFSWDFGQGYSHSETVSSGWRSTWNYAYYYGNDGDTSPVGNTYNMCYFY